MAEQNRDYDWTLGLNFQGHALEFRWRELYSSQGKSMGHYGFLQATDEPDSQDTPSYSFDRDEQWLKDALLATASTLRRREIRKDIPTTGFEWVASDEPKKAMILELFHRSEQGEYLGQLSSNQNLYVQDLAAILDLAFGHTRDLVDELVAEGKVGLDGMILVSNEHYEDSFRYWEEKTGHRRLTVGDWGPWGCQACGQSGDEYEDPSEYPCVTPEERKQASEAPAVEARSSSVSSEHSSVKDL